MAPSVALGLRQGDDYARQRTERVARRRRVQPDRICQALGDEQEGLRAQVLRNVLGYVDEHVWQEALADLRQSVREARRPGESFLSDDREWS